MLIKNQSTGNNYTAGEKIIYNGKEYIIVVKLFKVKSIVSNQKSIVVTLVDETGETVPCNFWISSYGYDPNIYMNNDQYTLAEIDVNDTVVMVGHYYMYGTQKQFRACGGYQISDKVMDFKPKFGEGSLNAINKYVEAIKDEKLYRTCKDMLKYYYDDFVKKPAAHSHHHNYIGGLLQHTAEVMTFAYNIASVTDCFTDHIIVAALFHDIEKVKEYTLEGDYLPYASEIGHVVGSAMTFREFADKNDVSYKDVEAIVHCILAHHGRKEWGSPVEPQTPEAAIVHEADMISSRLNPLYIKLREDLDKDYYMNW